MTEELFMSVRKGDVLRCTSSTLLNYTLGQEYTVEGDEAKRFGRFKLFLANDDAETTAWINQPLFNASFERVEPAHTGIDVPFVEPATYSPAPKKENPKDLIGNTKLGLRHVPLGALYEMAVAMDDGARKYGPFNWRSHPVRADVYVDAAKRHMEAWVHGEERAGDSGGHHLAHAMACMAILLDAQHHGTLKDNRDTNAKNFYDIIDQIQKERDAAKKVLDDDEKQRM